MKSLGQIAYEAFGATLGVEIRKRLIPDYSTPWGEFSTISPELQAAWEAAAEAVLAMWLKKPAEFA